MSKSSLAAIAIIAAATVIAIASSWNDSPVVDEVPHIGAGYTYVAKQSYLFNPEHPPLAKSVAALPLLTLPIDQTIYNRSYQANWPTDANGEWNFGRTLIYHSGVDPIKLVRLMKLPMLLFFILTAILIFVWTRSLYGPRGGLLALFLFSFSPTVLAHSRLVTTDVAALWGVTLATFFFVRYLANSSENVWRKFWLAAIAFGLAELTKFSLILLAPYFVVLGVIWGYAHGKVFQTVWKSILVMAVGLVIIVGPAYQYTLIHYGPTKQKMDTTTMLSTYGNRLYADTDIWASDKPILRPFAEYALGILMVFQRNAGGNQTYFLGQIYNKAVKSYFPIVFGLKEPIPFLALALLALLGLIFVARPKENHIKPWLRNHFSETAMLLWILIYWYTSINANLNIGIRHLMPVYSFTYILVAGQIIVLGRNILSTRGKQAHLAYDLVVYGLLGWILIEIIAAFPSYLSYFNEFALRRPSWVSASDTNWTPGGQNYVVDSNLDWGQDLKRLADWVDANNVKKISLDYFGWAEQMFYLDGKFVWITSGQYKNPAQFLKENPSGGYIAVSATFYEQSIVGDQNYAWLKDYKPVAFIGHSIFVWYISPNYALR